MKPIEEKLLGQLYCFCGGGDDTGGGGSSSGGGNSGYSTDDAYESGNQQTGQGSKGSGGGGGDDERGMGPSWSGPGGSGSPTSGGGSNTDDAYENQQTGQGSKSKGGGGDDDDPFVGDEIDYSFPDFPDFDDGDVGDTGGIALSNLGPSPGPGDDDPIERYLSGPMLADISTPLNLANPDVMADIPAIDYENMARGLNLGPSPGSPGVDDSLLGQIGPGGEVFDFSGDLGIFGDLPEQQVPEGTPNQAPKSVAQNIVDSVLEDARREGALAARNAFEAGQAVGGAPGITFGGVDINNLDPVDLDEVPAGALNLASTGVTLAGSPTPAEQVTAGLPDGTVVSETVLGGPRENNRPTGTVSITQPSTGITSLTDVETGRPPSDGGQGSTSGVGPQNIVDANGNVVGVSRTVGVGDTITQAEIDRIRGEGKAKQGTPPGTPPDTSDSGPRLPSAMTMQKTTPIGPQNIVAGPNEPYLDDKIIDEIKKQAEEPRPNIIQGFIDDLTDRDAAFAREVTRPGNIFQRDPDGNITGVYNPQTNSVYTPANVGVFDLSAQEKAAGDLYDMQRNERDSQRENRGGNDDQPGSSAPRSTEVVPAPDPRSSYSGRDLVGEYNYRSRGPMSYAYTGLPSLAPQKLRPSFQAQGSYTPLFPVGPRRR